jgi:hypothetical protein
MIKSIGEEDSDWRALDAWLQRSFPADYRRDSKVEVTANANAASGFPVLSIEEQAKRQERLRRLRGQI